MATIDKTGLYFKTFEGFVVKNKNITNSSASISTNNAVDISKLTHYSIIFLVNVALSIFVILRRNLRRKKRNQLFLNLQVTNIVFSVAAIVFESKYAYEHVIIYNGLLIGKFFALILVTLERLMAIKFPLRHKQITSKKLFTAIMLSWIPGIGFVCLSIFVEVSKQRDLLITHTVIIILAGIVLTIANGIIYVAAKRHDEFVKKNAANQAKTNEKKRMKASLVCLSMVASFNLVWFPMFVHDLMSLAGQYKAGDGQLLSVVVEYVPILNSFADPFLFIWLSAEMKKEFKKLFKKEESKTRAKEKNEKDGKNVQICKICEDIIPGILAQKAAIEGPTTLRARISRPSQSNSQ